MKVAALRDALEGMPDEAEIHLDDDTYPRICGCYLSTPEEFDGDPEDAPPMNVVLLEIK